MQHSIRSITHFSHRKISSRTSEGNISHGIKRKNPEGEEYEADAAGGKKVKTSKSETKKTNGKNTSNSQHTTRDYIKPIPSQNKDEDISSSSSSEIDDDSDWEP